MEPLRNELRSGLAARPETPASGFLHVSTRKRTAHTWLGIAPPYVPNGANEGVPGANGLSARLTGLVVQLPL